MVIYTLTPEQIDDGKRFVEHLDAVGPDVDAAFWFLSADEPKWKLFLSVPAADGKGPLFGYKLVHVALTSSGIQSIRLDDISLAYRDSFPLDALRTAVHTSRELRTIRLTRNYFNGSLIPDAVVYRLLPSPRTAPSRRRTRAVTSPPASKGARTRRR